MLDITRRRDATSNTLQLRPSPQSYNNSKQQSKHNKSKHTATSTPKRRPDGRNPGTDMGRALPWDSWVTLLSTVFDLWN